MIRKYTRNTIIVSLIGSNMSLITFTAFTWQQYKLTQTNNANYLDVAKVLRESSSQESVLLGIGNIR